MIQSFSHFVDAAVPLREAAHGNSGNALVTRHAKSQTQLFLSDTSVVSDDREQNRTKCFPSAGGGTSFQRWLSSANGRMGSDSLNTGNGLTPVASSRIGRDACETTGTDGSRLQHHERINKSYIIVNTKGYLNKGGKIVLEIHYLGRIRNSAYDCCVFSMSEGYFSQLSRNYHGNSYVWKGRLLPG
jgi:hypothetical protein